MTFHEFVHFDQFRVIRVIGVINPKAANQTFWRVCSLFIGTLTFIFTNLHDGIDGILKLSHHLGFESPESAIDFPALLTLGKLLRFHNN